MPLRHHSTRVSISSLLILAMPTGAAPIASNATYPPVAEDTALIVPLISGLMNHVAPNGAVGALSVVRVGNAAHGNVVVNKDGAFTYTPEANYSGPDSFTYKAVEGEAPVVFTVDEPNSVFNIRAQTTVNATGVSDDKTAISRVKGTVGVLLTPHQSPFSVAQIQTVDVAVSRTTSLTMCVVRVIVCAGTVTARIDTDGFALKMAADEAGPPVTVTGGSFTQPGNRIRVNGTLNLSTGGVAGAITVPPTATLDSTQDFTFTDATITQTGNTLNLAIPISIQQPIDETEFSGTVTLSGTIRATAPVPSVSPESGVATVSLSVTPEDDAAVSSGDRYYTLQNQAINIPAVGSVPLTESLINAGSAWKYSTGSDLPTGWRAVNFNDTAWASGAGVLGYDTDNPIATTVPARANMGAAASSTNPNYPAAYFRKEFTVTGSQSTTGLTLEFQRDDACVIFVNGFEVFRDNSPYNGGTTAPLAAIGEIAYAGYTAADIQPDSSGAGYKSISVPSTLLVEGKNVIAAMVKQASNTSGDMRWDLRASRTRQQMGSAPLVNGIWKYSTGTSLATSWRAPDYDDATWRSAPGPLGYDSDIPAGSTITARANMMAAASTSNPNYPTAYFRGDFTLANPFDIVQPRLDFQRDDACVIYVNGVEVYRDSTPYPGDADLPLPAAGEVPYATYAASSIVENESLIYKSVTFSRSLLRTGRNIIAAEVHQGGATSSDIRFDLRMVLVTGVGGLTSNDTDTDGPASNVAMYSPPSNGNVSILPDGSFLYNPDPGFPASGASATDSFVYAHRDESGLFFLSSEVTSPMASTWSYLDSGTAAPQNAGITSADWRNAAFNEAGWKTGVAEFGYGETDQATTVEDNAALGYVAADTDRYITTYFRRRFSYNGSPELVSSLKVRVVLDDGIVVWLNGQRIVKDNMPETWDHLTRASNALEGSPPIEITNIPPDALREGENILAVEIHQQSASSSDVSFDMELSVKSIAGARADVVVFNDDLDNDNMSDLWEQANGVDGTVANAGADLDMDGQTNRQEFLAGTDPRSAASALRATGLAATGNPRLLNMTFSSVPGKTYRIEYSDSLSGWLPAGGNVSAHPSAGETSAQVVKPTSSSRHYYRAAVIGTWE